MPVSINTEFSLSFGQRWLTGTGREGVSEAGHLVTQVDLTCCLNCMARRAMEAAPWCYSDKRIAFGTRGEGVCLLPGKDLNINAISGHQFIYPSCWAGGWGVRPGFCMANYSQLSQLIREHWGTGICSKGTDAAAKRTHLCCRKMKREKRHGGKQRCALLCSHFSLTDGSWHWQAEFRGGRLLERRGFMFVCGKSAEKVQSVCLNLFDLFEWDLHVSTKRALSSNVTW